MRYELVQSIVLMSVGSGQLCFLVFAIWWSDWRARNTVKPYSPQSVIPGSVSLSDRPLPYLMRRMGFVCSTSLLLLGLDVDRRWSFYSMPIVALLHVWVEALMFLATAIWIGSTVRTLHRQLNRNERSLNSPGPASSSELDSARFISLSTHTTLIIRVVFAVPVLFFVISATAQIAHARAVPPHERHIPAVLIQFVVGTVAVFVEAVMLVIMYRDLKAHFLAILNSNPPPQLVPSGPLSPARRLHTASEEPQIAATNPAATDGWTNPASENTAAVAPTAVSSPANSVTRRIPRLELTQLPTAGAAPALSASTQLLVSAALNRMWWRIVLMIGVGVGMSATTIASLIANPYVTPTEFTANAPAAFHYWMYGGGFVVCSIANPFSYKRFVAALKAARSGNGGGGRSSGTNGHTRDPPTLISSVRPR